MGKTKSNLSLDKLSEIISKYFSASVKLMTKITLPTPLYFTSRATKDITDSSEMKKPYQIRKNHRNDKTNRMFDIKEILNTIYL